MSEPKGTNNGNHGVAGRSGPPGNKNHLKHGYYSLVKLVKAKGGALDRRTILGKYVVALEQQLTSDLGGDLSTAQRMLLRDVALDTLLLEGLNRDAVAYLPIRKGKIRPVHTLRAQLIAQRREHLKLLGIRRVLKTVSLNELLAEPQSDEQQANGKPKQRSGGPARVITRKSFLWPMMKSRQPAGYSRPRWT
jgi:hypothetical protein